MGADKDPMGDRMKLYEGVETERRLMPLLPAMARLDGKCFSRFTKGMTKPFDQRMIDCMIETTLGLVKETNACCGYCQSDEISLTWFTSDIKSQIYHDGKIQKMVSTLTSLASVLFYRAVLNHFGEEYARKVPTWDCRVWNVPNLMEGSNVFLWRERDATRNSILVACQQVASHKEMHGLETDACQELLWQRGVNWNNYPSCFKRGTFVTKKRVVRPFTTEEIHKLPIKHAARTNPDLTVERWQIQTLEMPPFDKVTNRPGVIFCGEDPILLEK